MIKYFIISCLLWANFAMANSTIKLVVPFAAGTTLDLTAKILQQDLSRRLQKTVVIENKPGAGGAIGANYVATNNSSDVVLLIAGTGLPINSALDPNTNINNLMPIVKIGTAPILLVTSTKSNIHNFQDLLKSNNITLGNAGENSLTFLISEMIKKDINKNLIPVPYKGANLAIPDLLSGDLNGAFLFYSSALPYTNTQKMVPIAVVADHRLDELPNIPTFKELKINSVDPIDIWFAIFCNSGANTNEVNLIKAELSKSLRDAQVIQSLKANGIYVSKKPNLPSDFLITEQVKYQKIIQK